LYRIVATSLDCFEVRFQAAARRIQDKNATQAAIDSANSARDANSAGRAEDHRHREAIWTPSCRDGPKDQTRNLGIAGSLSAPE
jgi:hypothetical protein